MSEAPSLRLIVTKAALWLLLGAASAVGAVRYLAGLGLTTALSDLTPWGLWIGLDVMAGVALAAGGFVIAATVHVFHLQRYHALLRPAILTAFLGYVAVVLGLLVDLGRPWNIWRMIFFWQPTSALFEVGWCVMLYLTVLALEFAPVVFEGLKLNRAYQIARHFTLPLVITGIALSTLHQSSLGTLLVIAPNRVHPLWYSPILPVLFLISAVGLGLAMVTAESLSSSWLFHREPEWPLLRGLTRAAAVVLGLYLVLRLGDLAWRGSLRFAVSGAWPAALFIVEILVSTVIPILLFTLPSARSSGKALGIGAFLAVLGFILHRADTGGISHIPATGDAYVPALTELAMSLGVIAVVALAFLFFVEHLKVWEEPPAPPDHFRAPLVDPLTLVSLRGPWFGGPQRAALAWVVGALLGLALVESEVARRSDPCPRAIGGPRSVAVRRLDQTPRPGHRLLLAAIEPVTDAEVAGIETALLIDGDHRGGYVVFEHDRHQQRLGGLASCARCHHANLPLDRATSCAACHRDMYTATDTFSHERHVAALGTNASCVRCHATPEQPKTRAASAPCTDCHRRHATALPFAKARSSLPLGFAPGYRAALHGLCITCHREEDAKHASAEPYFSRCPTCHRELSPSGSELRLREGWASLAVTDRGGT